jgi:hypothetical protein
MNDDDRDLRQGVADLAAAARHRLGPHPDADELAAYHTGTLAPADEKRVQDHLVVCQPCAAALLDIARFIDAEEEGEEVPADLADSVWEGVAAQIRRDDPRPSAAVLSFPTPKPELPSRSRALQALAAALLVACLGLSVWVASLRRTVSDLSRPQANAPVIDLYSGIARGEGTPRPVEPVPQDARLYTVILHPASPQRGKEYRVEIVRADGAVVWSETGLLLNAYGSLGLIVPRSALGSGDFRIRLFAKEASVEEYELRVAGP